MSIMSSPLQTSSLHHDSPYSNNQTPHKKRFRYHNNQHPPSSTTIVTPQGAEEEEEEDRGYFHRPNYRPSRNQKEYKVEMPQYQSPRYLEEDDGYRHHHHHNNHLGTPHRSKRNNNNVTIIQTDDQPEEVEVVQRVPSSPSPARRQGIDFGNGGSFDVVSPPKRHRKNNFFDTMMEEDSPYPYHYPPSSPVKRHADFAPPSPSIQKTHSHRSMNSSTSNHHYFSPKRSTKQPPQQKSPYSPATPRSSYHPEQNNETSSSSWYNPVPSGQPNHNDSPANSNSSSNNRNSNPPPHHDQHSYYPPPPSQQHQQQTYHNHHHHSHRYPYPYPPPHEGYYPYSHGYRNWYGHNQSPNHPHHQHQDNRHPRHNPNSSKGPHKPYEQEKRPNHSYNNEINKNRNGNSMQESPTRRGTPPDPASQGRHKTIYSTPKNDTKKEPQSVSPESRPTPSSTAQAAIAAGMTNPQSASEIDFDIHNPPATPFTMPSKEAVCSGPSAVNMHDVLLGRGGGTNTQIGNRRFRALVQEFQPVYLLCRRKEKPRMARTIVLIVRNRGGRFLKKCDDTGMLFEVGDEKAEAKTSQALREGLDVRATKASQAGSLRKNKHQQNNINKHSASSHKELENKPEPMQESPNRRDGPPKELSVMHHPPSYPPPHPHSHGHYPYPHYPHHQPPAPNSSQYKHENHSSHQHQIPQHHSRDHSYAPYNNTAPTTNNNNSSFGYEPADYNHPNGQPHHPSSTSYRMDPDLADDVSSSSGSNATRKRKQRHWTERYPQEPTSNDTTEENNNNNPLWMDFTPPRSNEKSDRPHTEPRTSRNNTNMLRPTDPW